jgi:hypothetical protein
MRIWWINILLIVLFSFAAHKVRQSNAVNDPVIQSFLQGQAKFKSDVPRIDYENVLNLIYSSADLNTTIELSNEENMYDFHFIYNLDQNVSWRILLEKQKDILILREVINTESFESIIYCP